MANGGSGSGSPSGQSLIMPVFTTLAPSDLSSVSDPQALALFATQSGGDCYPGGTVTYSSFELFHSDAVQGTIAQPISSSILKWTTSDPKIATVNNGVVTCVALGTAKISATLPNATCETPSCNAFAYVVVDTAKHTMTLTPAAGAFKVGDTILFKVVLNTVHPDGSTTIQDVSSAAGIMLADSLIGSGGQVIWVDPAPSPSKSNQFKAMHAGTSWGFAQYNPGNQDVVQSNMYAITVQ
jgi:hypothetical protein